MAQTPADEERAQWLALGEALAALRRERGLSQAEAGARVAMTSQGWGLYEAGRRAGLFRPDVQRRLTAALDATPEDLALRLVRAEPIAALPPDGLEARGRAYVAAPPPPRATLRLSDDALAPWASSGVLLEYEPGRWPRRDQGCVIEMVTGEVRARLYESSDGDVVVVRGAGALDRAERIARTDIRQISAVLSRHET
ncbi:MAG: XRE family transcriptional regulator [Brevundimonas sp.]|uniref:helix-turn-helix domain-containing protein n=1 Tax=Brevundimonas sp. TaxID=1871086 RepID=UPI00122A8729|nr:helix-turn-helix transcriptional regulator [Brevundimonas sp.]RZJ18445.1 MAG: XRE family transcriptional regulator [Brevundimonas sp.]